MCRSVRDRPIKLSKTHTHKKKKLQNCLFDELFLMIFYSFFCFLKSNQQENTLTHNEAFEELVTQIDHVCDLDSVSCPVLTPAF